jgi:hypothetical protein
MFTNDYIMRQIEMLVRGIAAIMGLKQENRLEESAALCTETLRKFFGLQDRSVEELPWRDLMAVASLGGVPDAERCALLAQLVKEKADVAAMQGGKASALYGKALSLYLYAWLADESLHTAEHGGRIDELIGIAGCDARPDELLQFLFKYYEQTGRYGKAEDELYNLIQSQGGGGDALGQGRAFYLRLLGRSDEDLIRGGLPRDEVVGGLKDLQLRSM